MTGEVRNDRRGNHDGGFVILGLDPGIHEVFPSSSGSTRGSMRFFVILGLDPGIHLK
jgi:hypothetical protein